MNTIQIGQVELDLIEGIFGLLGTILTIAVPILLPRLFAILKAHNVVVSTQLQTMVANDLHTAIPRAITFAKNTTEEDVDPKAQIAVGSPFMVAAADYLIAHKADALTMLGITPTTTSATIRDLILTHLPPPVAPAPAPIAAKA